MIPLKSEQDLAVMRGAGKILAEILRRLTAEVCVGITTAEINRRAEEYIKAAKVEPAFKGYRGYPANICVSINEEVVHGIPGKREIRDGDIIGIDLGIKKDNYFADMAFTVGVGKVNGNVKKLIEAAKKALELGIKQAKVNNHLMDISYAIQSCAESRGFSVVRDFVGHGIGTSLHEDPEVPNFGKPHTGAVLKEGLVLAIETMVNMGSWEVFIKDNGWTAVTKDSLPSAHFEHTVAITNSGPKILTQ